METKTPSTIRPARPGDARAIAEVQVAGWHAAYRGLMPDAKLDAFTVEVRAPRWQGHLAEVHADRLTAVVEREGRIVAFGTFGPSRDAEGQGEVWALYAHPDAWGTGAGRALLDEGCASCRSRGGRARCCGCSPATRARSGSTRRRASDRTASPSTGTAYRTCA